ncbi:YbaK/EbsC family protein [Rhodoferax sp. TBRC 17660]|uniref:YbaK/EbsC family protein n=1 Tax=Rhodoferax potami TaxID=3068338 RepID=A0ABU3KLM6_9BURK|nr:YbaK/EbsC family protein [Rhodoferax sp. TBRC 17660]MDT7518332.1 YbaK/EbsC family protein [Rhodoferax sp. TBRC 17660]
MTELPEGVQRVAAALQDKNHPHGPVMLDGAARTAQQAADALGVAVGQIAKSIIFKRVEDDAAVLVVTSGDRRVDEAKVAALVGPLARANAAFVKERTGFSIGGVSPVAHAMPGVTLIDRELFRFEQVWAAAGHPHGVFQLQPQDLVALTGAPVADVVEAPEEENVLDTLARENAIKMLAARALSVSAMAENIPSPCVNVCRMDTGSGLCEGCFRTIEDIREWGRSDDAAKKAMWVQITERLQQTHPTAFA